MVSGSSVVEFGTRNLSLHSCLSHRTVARVLRMLAAEDDPLIDLVSPRRMARADRYSLRIPDRYADSVRWRRRRAGRIEAAHPAFLAFGGTSALVYQVLDQAEACGAEVARAARLSASATSAALRVLAEHGLAERGPDGWRRGPVALADVAESAGATGPAARTGGAVSEGPGELAGPAPAVPGCPAAADFGVGRLVVPRRRRRVRRDVPMAGAER